MEELRNSLKRREETCSKYLKHIQELKDASNKVDIKMRALEKDKNQAELELLHSAQSNGN